MASKDSPGYQSYRYQQSFEHDQQRGSPEEFDLDLDIYQKVVSETNAREERPMLNSKLPKLAQRLANSPSQKNQAQNVGANNPTKNRRASAMLSRLSTIPGAIEGLKFTDIELESDSAANKAISVLAGTTRPEISSSKVQKVQS